MPIVTVQLGDTITGTMEEYRKETGHYWTGPNFDPNDPVQWAGLWQFASDWLFKKKLDEMESDAERFEAREGPAEIKRAARAAEGIHRIEVATGSPSQAFEVLNITKSELENKIEEIAGALVIWKQSYALQPSTGGARGIALNEVKISTYRQEYDRLFNNGPGTSRQAMANAVMANSGAVGFDVSVTSDGENFKVKSQDIKSDTQLVKEINEELNVSSDAFVEGFGKSLSEKEDEEYFDDRPKGKPDAALVNDVIAEKEKESNDWLSQHLPKVSMGLIATAGIALLYLLSRRRRK